MPGSFRGDEMSRWMVVLAGWIAAYAAWAGYSEGTVRYPLTRAFVWESDPPASCPFERSKSLGGICFTGQFANYTMADTWYPSWASDGNLYSPYTDGWFDSHLIWSGGVTNTTTGNAKAIGDDPLNLQVVDLGTCQASAVPYGGRYPSASLVYNGVWYYGTYAVHTKNSIWDLMGPFVGFRVSRDYGKSWDEPHADVSHPIFGESSLKEGQKVKIGSPHFVDFGKNMEYSPDGKAYLLAHGGSRPGADVSWCSGDEIYLLRTVPSPETINDPSAYEFFAGRDAKGKAVWTRDFNKIQPLFRWKNNAGIVNACYNPALGKYLMCVTYGGRGGGPQLDYDSYILESDSITGPWKLVSYMRHFGPQGYFLNFPVKFISPDGKTLWLAYSTNWSQKFKPGNPPGGRYGWALQQVRLLSPQEARHFKRQPQPSDPLASKNNVARKAKVTVSSVADGDGSAKAAIDGVVNGFPLNAPAEWASNEGVGAWIRLAWDRPQTIREVWLFDRPVAFDSQITGGELRFSDGSSISVGALPDEGQWKGKRIVFEKKNVRWMEFKATRVKGSRVGLAEVAVFRENVELPPNQPSDLEECADGMENAKK